MNVELLNNVGSNRLLLIFSGWASDSRLFAKIKAEGYTTMIVSDYTTFTPAIPNIDNYEEICVLAWSFGIVHAAEFLARNKHLPITLSIAFNGTTYPVDDFRGIPSAIFNGTLSGLNERNLQKFYRRMCPDSQTYKQVCETLSGKDIEALKAELEAIGNRHFPNAEQFQWDLAIIGNNDHIIPTANQINAWQKTDSRIVHTDWAHLPDFQDIINKNLINKQLVAKRFTNAAESYSRHAVVQQQMTKLLAKELSEAIAANNLNIIEFGAGNGDFTNQYLSQLKSKIANLTLWDISTINPQLPGNHVITDAELQIKSEADNSADIICGSATIQWFNNPLRFIHECYRVLRPGGILAFSTFTPDNFHEISPFVGSLPLLSSDKWKTELQKAGFKTSLTNEKTTISFDDTRQLLLHLKLTGVNALSTSGAVSAAKRILANNIRSLTYSPLYIIASKL